MLNNTIQKIIDESVTDFLSDTLTSADTVEPDIAFCIIANSFFAQIPAKDQKEIMTELDIQLKPEESLLDSYTAYISDKFVQGVDKENLVNEWTPVLKQLVTHHISDKMPDKVKNLSEEIFLANGFDGLLRTQIQRLLKDQFKAGYDELLNGGFNPDELRLSSKNFVLEVAEDEEEPEKNNTQSEIEDLLNFFSDEKNETTGGPDIDPAVMDFLGSNKKFSLEELMRSPNLIMTVHELIGTLSLSLTEPLASSVLNKYDLEQEPFNKFMDGFLTLWANNTEEFVLFRQPDLEPLLHMSGSLFKGKEEGGSDILKLSTSIFCLALDLATSKDFGDAKLGQNDYLKAVVGSLELVFQKYDKSYALGSFLETIKKADGDIESVLQKLEKPYTAMIPVIAKEFNIDLGDIER